MRMPELPEDVVEYRRTTVFDCETVPKGLLRSHQVKTGVWGEIVVTRGQLTYVIETLPPATFSLDDDHRGVVEPEQAHHVSLGNDSAFYVRFLRKPAQP